MKGTKELRTLLIALCGVALIAPLMALVLQFGWNHGITPALGFPALTYWQALMIWIAGRCFA